jgi:hypothetical protein
MKTKESDWKKKVPKVKIVTGLNKYKDPPHFQEKLDKVNEILRKAGVPKTKDEG